LKASSPAILFVVHSFPMGKKGKQDRVFSVECPTCRSLIWLDPVTREIMRVEKGKKKKESLDELLSREKEKRETFERKFEATSELQKQKQRKARELFEKALTKADKEDSS